MESMKKTIDDERWIRLMELGHVLGCHQMPSRSFFLRGYQFPVCARCTGVIVGELLALVLLAGRVRIGTKMMMLLLAVMGGDWLIQEVGILESTNPRRFITGLCGGIGVTSAYIFAFQQIRRFRKFGSSEGILF